MVRSGIDWTTVPFHKSSHSSNDGGNCVEVGVGVQAVGIRDSTLGAASPVLELSPAAFAAFLCEVRRHPR